MPSKTNPNDKSSAKAKTTKPKRSANQNENKESESNEIQSPELTPWTFLLHNYVFDMDAQHPKNLIITREAFSREAFSPLDKDRVLRTDTEKNDRAKIHINETTLTIANFDQIAAIVSTGDIKDVNPQKNFVQTFKRFMEPLIYIHDNLIFNMIMFNCVNFGDPNNRPDIGNWLDANHEQMVVAIAIHSNDKVAIGRVNTYGYQWLAEQAWWKIKYYTAKLWYIDISKANKDDDKFKKRDWKIYKELQRIMSENNIKESIEDIIIKYIQFVVMKYRKTRNSADCPAGIVDFLWKLLDVKHALIFQLGDRDADYFKRKVFQWNKNINKKLLRNCRDIILKIDNAVTKKTYWTYYFNLFQKIMWEPYNNKGEKLLTVNYGLHIKFYEEKDNSFGWAMARWLLWKKINGYTLWR